MNFHYRYNALCLKYVHIKTISILKGFPQRLLFPGRLPTGPAHTHLWLSAEWFELHWFQIWFTTHIKTAARERSQQNWFSEILQNKLLSIDANDCWIGMFHIKYNMNTQDGQQLLIFLYAIQCGAVIRRWIFSKILTKQTWVARPWGWGMGCLL